MAQMISWEAMLVAVVAGPPVLVLTLDAGGGQESVAA